MSPEVARVLFVVFSIWGVAVAFKAWNALSKHEAYTFSFWDGGLARSGRRLTPTGAKVKLVAGLVMTAWCVVSLTGLYIGQLGYLIFLGLIVVSIISDFANTEV